MENNISNVTAIYDLKRHHYHAVQVHEGILDGKGLSKEGALRRMQVYDKAIKSLENEEVIQEGLKKIDKWIRETVPTVGNPERESIKELLTNLIEKS